MMLVNCRVHLQPIICESFLKFIRVKFGLGEVIMSRPEIENLYVGVLRLLKGDKTTLDDLLKVGMIENRRKMEQNIEVWKKFAKSNKKKNNRHSTTASSLGNQSIVG